MTTTTIWYKTIVLILRILLFTNEAIFVLTFLPHAVENYFPPKPYGHVIIYLYKTNICGSMFFLGCAPMIPILLSAKG